MSGTTGDPTDERLTLSVEQALQRSEPMRATVRGNWRVEARGGMVRLRGVVASEAHRAVAGQLARGVPGVKDVVNELVTDVELERLVAAALGSDDRTRGHRVVVRVLEGAASLYGVVPAQEVADTVVGVARAVPGVAGVGSKLSVAAPGKPVILVWQHSLEGRPLASKETGRGEPVTGGASRVEVPGTSVSPKASMEGAS